MLHSHLVGPEAGFTFGMEREPPALGALFAPEVVVDCSLGRPLVADAGYRVADPLEERASLAWGESYLCASTRRLEFRAFDESGDAVGALVVERVEYCGGMVVAALLGKLAGTCVPDTSAPSGQIEMERNSLFTRRIVPLAVRREFGMGSRSHAIAMIYRVFC